MTKANRREALQLIENRANRAVRKRVSVNEKNGDTTPKSDLTNYQTVITAYLRQLGSLANAAESGSRTHVKAARTRVFDGFAGRLVGTLQATQDIKQHLSFGDLESRAKQLSMYDTYNEVVTIKPEAKPGKPGEWRPLALTGPRRKAQQRILMDVLLVVMGDSPCDSSVAGAGGEASHFGELKSMIGEGYHYWASLDLCDYFPSLRPGHLAEYPLPEWMIKNLVFLPADAKIRFVDSIGGLCIPACAIQEANEDDLPNGYPYSMESIRATFHKVRQGLIQGDTCAPQIARTFLWREIQRTLKDREVAFCSHIDDVLLGACTQSELELSIKALTHRLQSHPAGPLKLHEFSIRHASETFHYLGNRVGWLKDGSVHVRPGEKRFNRFRERLLERLQASVAFTKAEVAQVAFAYARDWFRAQPAWTKEGIGAGNSKCEGASWDYVVAEVYVVVNQFIYAQLTKGIGFFHIDDIDQEFLTIGAHDDALS